MIDWLVNALFKWDSLRIALFSEVHMYDELDKIINDPEAMKIGATFWPDSDGWRGWSYNESKDKYYFNDIPEDGTMEAWQELDRMQTVEDLQMEFDLGEIW